MCHHLNPWSVNTYLSGISQQLEIHENERNPHRSQARTHSCRSSTHDLSLSLFHSSWQPSLRRNAPYRLFQTPSIGWTDLSGWCLTSELERRKVTRRTTVKLQDSFYEFTLPGHIADRFFEGNKIIIPAHQFTLHPLHHFSRYLASRDSIHPVASPLWLTEAGTVPTRSFFVNRLCIFFDKDVAGQSMRAGGATTLAEHGASPAIIQASGRWASKTFLIYIHKNPTLLQGFLSATAIPDWFLLWFSSSFLFFCIR